MKHIFWLIQDQLCGRSGPNHEPWDASELQSAGVGAVLSVNSADSVYADDFSFVGMSHRCIPLAANAPPRDGDLELCVSRLPLAYEYALNEIESGKSVLVHCRQGKDRTGLFMAYFLRRQLGMSSKDAIDRVKTVRPIAFTAEGWEQFAIDVLDACRISA
jgi:protein-tyrosine phosphatase